MTNQNPDELSKPTLKDIWYAIAKGTISIIPIYGNTLTELISLLAVAPATKRRDKWVNEQLTEAFRLIAEKVDVSTFESLPNNELFLTVVMQATSIALRNHQKEKFEALRNAIINSVLPNAPEESLQLTFLNFIDVFTPCHLVVMSFIDNPREWCRKHNVIVDSSMMAYNSFPNRMFRQMDDDVDNFLEKIFPERRKNIYIYKKALDDLAYEGLLTGTIHGDSLNMQGTPWSLIDLHNTVISLSATGKQFLNYIADGFDS